ncbi:MAG: heavy-metal-associated domain-containing protein [Nitrospinales bacterium]
MKKVSLEKSFLLTVVFLISMAGMTYGDETGTQKTELLQQFQLKVTGLKCRSCIPDVRKSLKKVSGVRDAKITKFDKAGSDTVVEVIPGSVSGEQLVSALKATGFQAEITSIGEPRKVLLKQDSGFSIFGLFN